MRPWPLALVLASACAGSASVDATDESPTDDTETESEVETDTDADTDDGGTDVDTDTVETDDTDSVVDTDPPANACTFDDGVVPNLGATTGPERVDTRNGSKQFGDCEMTYKVFAPQGGGFSTAVVASHGFQRGPAQMEGWARIWASWGFEVVVPALCHSTIIGGVDHAANGTEIAALAEELFPGRPVIYAGHSAGGLASVLAGSADPETAGVFGLDLVDNNEEGRRKADLVDAPVWGLRGEPSLCNSQANGRLVYAEALDGRSHKVSEGTHCDFENATDVLCTGACWGPIAPRYTDADQSRAIRAMSTAFLMLASGEEPDAEQYWTVGCAPFDNLRRGGLVK